jgi:hypothetical protein
MTADAPRNPWVHVPLVLLSVGLAVWHHSQSQEVLLVLCACCMSVTGGRRPRIAAEPPEPPSAPPTIPNAALSPF